MRIGKILLVMTLLSAFLVPQLAFAVKGGSHHVHPDVGIGDNETGGGTVSGDNQDRRGVVRWFGDGNVFWWQLELLFRHRARWNQNLALYK